MTSKIVDEITKLFVTFESSQEDSPGREVPPPLKKAQSISSPDGILWESPSPIKGQNSPLVQTKAEGIIEEALDEQAHRSVKSMKKFQRLSLSGLRMQS